MKNHEDFIEELMKFHPEKKRSDFVVGEPCLSVQDVFNKLKADIEELERKEKETK